MKTRTIFISLVLIAVLLSACNVTPTVSTDPQTGTTVTQPDPSATTTTPISAPAQTQAIDPGQSTPSVTVDVSGVAQSFTTQVIAAVPPSPDAMWWVVMPEYSLMTLTGYPITKHVKQPQIFIFPVKDLGVNEYAGKAAESLETLLQNQQAGKDLPFLPAFNYLQMRHAQVEYQDFKNGTGMRYLTQYAQGIVPINNRELFYTFQGLTSDGKYYVAAVLPVNLASLPADGYMSEQDSLNLTSDYNTYLDKVVTTLNQQSASAFTPDLSQLDTLVQSIEVK